VVRQHAKEIAKFYLTLQVHPTLDYGSNVSKSLLSTVTYLVGIHGTLCNDSMHILKKY